MQARVTTFGFSAAHGSLKELKTLVELAGHYVTEEAKVPTRRATSGLGRMLWNLIISIEGNRRRS